MTQDTHHDPASQPTLVEGAREAEAEKETLWGTGIGTLLRREREKKGFSREQVSEWTRLRPYIIEALEGEDWDRLPSQGFVKGFIRSYARALGLKEARVMDLFREAVPDESSPIMPLVGPPKRRLWLRLLWLPVLLALIVTLTYYLWRGYPGTDRRSTAPRAPESETVKKGPEKGQTVPSEEPDVATEPEARPPGVETSVPEEPPPREEKAGGGDLPQKEMAPGEELADMGPPAEPEPKVVAEAPTPVSSGPPEREVPPELVLKAHVKERTWLRIVVDGKEPKEYIFQPGSHPEWKGEKGFELLIGNAGGIQLEFNGEEIGKVGERGEVVRLRFPRGVDDPSPSQ